MNINYMMILSEALWDSISSILLAPHADATDLLTSLLHHQGFRPPVGHQEPDAIILDNSDDLNIEEVYY